MHSYVGNTRFNIPTDLIIDKWFGYIPTKYLFDVWCRISGSAQAQTPDVDLPKVEYVP